MFFRTVMVSVAVCSLVLAGHADAEPKPSSAIRLLVQRIEAVGTDPTEAKAVEEALTLELGKRAGITVVTAAEMEQTMQFTAKSASLGCTKTQECVTEIQKKLKVERIVFGQLARLASDYVLTVNEMNAANGAVTRRVTREVKRFDQVKDGVGDVVDEMLGKRAQKAAFKLPAGQTLRLAVMPLAGRGIAQETADAMTSILAAELNSVNGVKVLSQDDIQAILSKVTMQKKAGCTENMQCIIEIGASLGLSKLIAGSVGEIKGTYVISLQLIDTRKADVQNRVLESFAGSPEELTNAVKLAAYQVIGVDASSKPGAVELSVNVREAEAALGETKAKVADGVLRVADVKPGRYPLRIVANPDDFVPLQTDIYVAPGATNTRSVEVIAKPVPWYKTWWFWTVTSVVVLGAAGTTTYFLLQSNEPPPASGNISVEPANAAVSGAR